MWAAALGLVLNPTTAVLVTVCVLNLLVVLSVVRLRDPVLPLIIWVLVPVGFAVTLPMASPATGSLGVPPNQLPRLRLARAHLHPPQAVLRF